MRRLVLLAFVVFAPAALADPPPDGAAIYRANCAECHGALDYLWGDAPGPAPTRLTMRAQAQAHATTLAFAGRALPYPGLVLKVNRRRHATGTVRYGGETIPLEPLDEGGFWASRGPALWVDASRDVTWVRAPAASLSEIALR